MKKTILLQIVLMISVCFTLLMGCSSNTANDPYTISGFYFDTYVSITIYDTDLKEEELNEIGQDCKDRCRYYEELLSVTNEASDISRINEAHGAPTEVDPETAALITQAVYYADLTGGSFDPTLRSVSRLWGFTSDEPCVPEPDAIEEAIQHIDYHTIQIEENTITLLDPLAQLDLGGIAKGFAADRLKDYLMDSGVEHALISLGGNVLCIGAKPDGNPFIIGLQEPFAQTGTVLASVNADDVTVVTSGNYERYFEENGILYHHIIDPSTGYPSTQELYGVTIMASSSTAADALSTACFVLGEEKGSELLNSLDGTYGFFIETDNSIHATDNTPDGILNH